MPLDLNSGSGAVYGRVGTPTPDTTARVNGLIDAALVARQQRQRPRDYLGGSRIGEPCARKLVYEITHALFEMGLSIVSAKISTRLDQVVDAFYVTERATGGKVPDEKVAPIVERLRAVITSGA